MSIARLIDFDELFANSKGVLFSEELPLVSKTVAADLIRTILATKEELSFFASCPCGSTNGNYYEGMLCKVCGKEVVPDLHTAHEYKLWLKWPDFAPPLLQPRAYVVLRDLLKSYKGTHLLNLLLWVDGGELPEDIAAWYKPGWHNFHDRFDELIEYLCTKYPPFQKKDNLRITQQLSMFVRVNRSRIFCTKIPVLNASFHQVTSSGNMKYVDEPSRRLMELIPNLSFAQYHVKYHRVTQRYINNVISRLYMKYIEYLDAVLYKKLIGEEDKKGDIRHSGMGIRCHWSFRGVIVPIVEDHVGDEIHLPWSIMVKTHALQCINLMVNRLGYTQAQATTEYQLALRTYSPTVHNILNTLIEECPFKGLPLVLNRNPSMWLGALQLRFATKILLGENIIAISDLCIRANNADLTKRKR